MIPNINVERLVRIVRDDFRQRGKPFTPEKEAQFREIYTDYFNDPECPATCVVRARGFS